MLSRTVDFSRKRFYAKVGSILFGGFSLLFGYISVRYYLNDEIIDSIGIFIMMLMFSFFAGLCLIKPKELAKTIDSKSGLPVPNMSIELKDAVIFYETNDYKFVCWCIYFYKKKLIDMIFRERKIYSDDSPRYQILVSRDNVSKARELFNRFVADYK